VIAAELYLIETLPAKIRQLNKNSKYVYMPGAQPGRGAFPKFSKHCIAILTFAETFKE